MLCAEISEWHYRYGIKTPKTAIVEIWTGLSKTIFYSICYCCSKKNGSEETWSSRTIPARISLVFICKVKLVVDKIFWKWNLQNHRYPWKSNINKTKIAILPHESCSVSRQFLTYTRLLCWYRMPCSCAGEVVPNTAWWKSWTFLFHM